MGAELLDSLQYCGSPVDLDVSLVIMIVIFLGMMVYLNQALFQPYLKLKDTRYERIQGAKASATEMQSRAEETLDTYEAKITEARTGAVTERSKARQQAKRAETEILASARSEIETALSLSRSQLEDEIARAEKEIRAEAESLAKVITERVLAS